MEYKCMRCKAKVVFEGPEVSSYCEADDAGWRYIDYGAYAGYVCPHCYHELKRFLAGEEIKKLVS